MPGRILVLEDACSCLAPIEIEWLMNAFRVLAVCHDHRVDVVHCAFRICRMLLLAVTPVSAQ